MHLDCVCDPRLPKLAWLAILKKDSPVVKVLHGEWVEANTQFVFEGAWASDFAAVDFDRCETVVGSGIVLRDGRAVFCSGSHVMFRLHILQQGDEMFISNSFVYCLKAAGHRLKSDYALYFRDFQSIVRGLQKYRTQIPLDKGRIQLLYVDNLVVGPDLKIEYVRKPGAPDFSCYEEYHGYLKEMLKKIGENSGSPSRKITYAPISTISSGYDSAACAVLARGIDCTTAITFPSARGSEESDSGAEIGRQLGFSIMAVDRLAYQNKEHYPEAEFIAGGTAGDAGDFVFASLDDLLPQKLLITGFTGDGVWNPNEYQNRFMIQDGLGGTMMEEFRLRVGFVHLPVPIIGGRRGPELCKISRSPAMRQWVLGTGFDKPIPRRILEEAGVPRTWFGLNKKATGARFFDGPNRGPEDLRAHLSPSSYRDYQQYFRKFYKPNWQEHYYFFMSKLRWILDEGYRLFNKLIRGRLGLWDLKPMALRHYLPWIGKNWLLFHWAVDKTAERYEHSAKEVRNWLSSKPSGTRVF